MLDCFRCRSVVTCPTPAPAAIWEFVHVERSFNARKDEASEQNGSERHGYVDAEQNSVPECLRQNLYKQLRKTIKMLRCTRSRSIITGVEQECNNFCANDLAGRSLVGVQVEVDHLQVNSCINDIFQVL